MVDVDPGRPGMRAKRLRLAALWVGSLCVALVAGVLVGYVAFRPASEPGAAAQSPQSSSVVSSGGGRVGLSDGTVVELPPGAVDREARLTVAPATGVAAPPSALMLAGRPVEITLAGADLKRAATVRLSAPKPVDWPDGVRFEPILAYYDPAAKSWFAVESSYDSASGLLSGQAEHFSTWGGFSLDPRQWAESARLALYERARHPSGVSVICDTPVAEKDLIVTVTGSELVSYCVDKTASGLVLKIRGVKNYPLAVSWAGVARQVSNTDYRLDFKSFRAWLDKNWGGVGKDVALLDTGGDLDLLIGPDANAPVLVTVEYDARAQLAGIVDAAVSVVQTGRDLGGATTTAETVWGYAQDLTCGASTLDNFGDDFVKASTTFITECGAQALRDGTSKSPSFFSRLGGAIPKAIGGFFQTVGDVVNTPLSLYNAGQDVFTGRTSESFTLAVPGMTQPTTSPWPTKDKEGPPALYAWFGANMYGFPDFVSCGQGYCIAGLEDRVAIIQLDGLKDVGQVPKAVTDPRPLLAGKGLSAAVIEAVLKPGPA